jgi:predicted nucleotidyltransferase component of viral defense system
MSIPALSSFSLVGGTALSLQYGHRTSVDLDLFSQQKFDQAIISEKLVECFGSSYVFEGDFSKFGIFCYIENVKTDIVYYPHLPIAPLVTEDELRMYSSADIAAMKVQAILGRGRKKDFWDIAELLKHFTVKQIIEWHQQKYPSQMLLISIPQALTYFADADESEDPISLKGQTWTTVKQEIQQKVRDYLK